jgi:hypothetical protein
MDRGIYRKFRTICPPPPRFPALFQHFCRLCLLSLLCVAPSVGMSGIWLLLMLFIRVDIRVDIRAGQDSSASLRSARNDGGAWGCVLCTDRGCVGLRPSFVNHPGALRPCPEVYRPVLAENSPPDCFPRRSNPSGGGELQADGGRFLVCSSPVPPRARHRLSG